MKPPSPNWRIPSNRHRLCDDQLKNRLLLKDGLEKLGLVNYENEWWHYTLDPEVYPDSYFDFPVEPTSLSAR